MTKVKYLLTIVICLIIFPTVTKADCSYTRLAELSRIASNVQFSYTYEINEGYDELYESNAGYALYTVKITNVTDDIYIEDNYGRIYSSQSEFATDYSIGQTLTYTFYSNDDNCKDEKIMTRYLSLPYYNNFSVLEECEQYPEFSLCAKWLNTGSYTSEYFYEQLETYKNSDEVVDEEEEEIGLWDTIIQVVQDNKIKTILAGLAILFLIGVLVVKKVRK